MGPSNARSGRVQIHVFVGENADRHQVFSIDMTAKLASLAAEIKKKFEIWGDVDLYRADAEELVEFQDSLLANRIGPNECLVVTKVVDDASRNEGTNKNSIAIEETCRIAGDRFAILLAQKSLAPKTIGTNTEATNEVTKIIGTESAPCVQHHGMGLASVGILQENLGDAPAQGLSDGSQNSVYQDPGVIECGSWMTTNNSSMCKDCPTELHINVLGARYSDIPRPLESISLEPTAAVGELVRGIKESAEGAFSFESLVVSEIIPFSKSCSFLDVSHPLWLTNHPRAVGLSDGDWILAYIQPQGVPNMDIRARLEAIWPIPEATNPACCAVPGMQACMPLPLAAMAPFAPAGYPPFGFAVPSQNSYAPLEVPVRPAMVLVLVQNDPLLAGMVKVSGRADGIHHLVSPGRHGGWNHFIFYKMDGEKLKKDDKRLPSGKFFLPVVNEGAGVPFMFNMTPKQAYFAKGGGSFKKAKGICTAEVKCTGTAAELEALQHGCLSLEYYLSVGPTMPVGPEMSEKQQAPRGPFAHNFLELPIAHLPKASEQWNLQSAIGKDGKLIVALEVLNLKFRGGKEEV